MTRRTVVAAATLALLGTIHFTGSANATDEGMHPLRPHWHTRPVTYRKHTSLNSTFRSAIDTAASGWASYTKFWLSAGTDISGSIDYLNLDTHILFMTSGIPTAFGDACPSMSTAACTLARGRSRPQDATHLDDVDTVFNSQRNWTNALNNCKNMLYRDMTSVAIHELGLWGGLMDMVKSANQYDVMYGLYNGCQRATTVHDRNTQWQNYTDGGH